MRYAVANLGLRLTRPGRLVPWLGFALRGLVALRFKRAVCRQPPHEQETRWRFCTGCPYLADCPYGATFEPALPADAARHVGQDDAPRPVVLAPYFPVPERSVVGLTVPVRLTAVGDTAIAHLTPLVAALAEAGRAGLGPDAVAYEVVWPDGGTPRTAELRSEDLPPHPDALPGWLPRVGVGLTAPLFLRRDEKPLAAPPTLAELLRASLRALGRLFSLYGSPLLADFTALRSAAEGVRLAESCYERFAQEKQTSRGRQRFWVQGLAGGGVYEDVPLSLLPCGRGDGLRQGNPACMRTCR